jgi:hypothetical protein
MEEKFDPYLHWLGIRDPQRPPNHYRLLGLEPFETDPEVILNAADRQMMHIRRFQGGKHSPESQQVLNELAAAKICLLDAEKKTNYDASLAAKPTPPPVVRPSEAAVPPPSIALSPSAAASDFHFTTSPKIDFGDDSASGGVSIPSIPLPLSELHGHSLGSPDETPDYVVRVRGSRFSSRKKNSFTLASIVSTVFVFAAILIVLAAFWWIANNR